MTPRTKSKSIAKSAKPKAAPRKTVAAAPAKEKKAKTAEQEALDAARAANFRWLASLAGGPTVLAEFVQGSRSGYALAASGAKSVGPKMARRIETRLKLGNLWMDHAGRTHEQVMQAMGPRLRKLVKDREKARSS